MINIFINLFKGIRRVVVRQWASVLLFFCAIFLYSTTGFMYFEVKESPDLTWYDAAWWSVVTMTTVGYGDYFPKTTGGRLLVGLPTMLLGVSMLGYMLSMLATSILESKLKEVRGMAKVNDSDHVILCRYNSLESTLKLVDEIQRDASTREIPIILIDQKLDELPEELRVHKVRFVKGNPSRESVLEQANLRGARYVLIPEIEDDLAHSDSENLAVALTIERLHPSANTVVHCVDPEHAVFFERANVDSIVCLSALSSQMMIQELQDPGVHDILSELTSNAHGKQFYVVPVPQDVRSIPDLREHYTRQKSLLIGIRRGKDNTILPDDDFAIEVADQAILVGGDRPS